MKLPILALETATLVSSVALANSDTLVAELTLQTKMTHSEQLMPHVATVLEMAQVTLTDLSAIAVSIGPGSFTGLRIGLATAKALAYALKIPIIGVPTLEALAFGCSLPGIYLASLLDAQKNNVYQAVFQRQAEGWREVIPVHVLSCSEALDELAALSQPVAMLGEGAILYQQQIKERGGNLFLPPPHLLMPRAGNVAFLGQQLLQQSVQQGVMTLEPLYIRRSEAEVLWERRQNTGKGL
jgi:tRNA threonylcarbamoyladenosine biosynthesis protein TsaB